MLEKPGALMISPIYNMLFGEEEYNPKKLLLSEGQVSLSYKAYKTQCDSDMQLIRTLKLAPGE